MSERAATDSLMGSALVAPACMNPRAVHPPSPEKWD